MTQLCLMTYVINHLFSISFFHTHSLSIHPSIHPSFLLYFFFSSFLPLSCLFLLFNASPLGPSTMLLNQPLQEIEAIDNALKRNKFGQGASNNQSRLACTIDCLLVGFFFMLAYSTFFYTYPQSTELFWLHGRLAILTTFNNIIISALSAFYSSGGPRG